jgi:hypothetical protein
MRTGADMGNRANFAIARDLDWQLYYSHWAGARAGLSGPASSTHAICYGRGVPNRPERMSTPRGRG